MGETLISHDEWQQLSKERMQTPLDHSSQAVKEGWQAYETLSHSQIPRSAPADIVHPRVSPHT